MKKNLTSHLTNVISVTLGMRLFSMNIIIPFLSVYALNLKGGSPWLTGYALGIFGLTQAVLQIPFGILSDRIGYKKMLIAGLLMLIAGLLAAAYSQSIYWLIFSRALQGSGAIVTVGYSWISAVAENEERDKALTKLGAMLAGFNMLSFVVGPMVHIFLKVNQMFIFSAVLIAICLVWILFDTKQATPDQRQKHQIVQKEKSVYNKRTLTSGLMLTVNNLLVMSFFFMLPLLLRGILSTNQMWVVLTPAIIIALLLLRIVSKKASKGKGKQWLYVLYALQGIGFVFLYFHNLGTIIVATILLVSGSFSITTIVPIILNRHLSNLHRGKGNGVMVSLQYFGSFLGAALTGTLWHIAPNATFLFAGLITLGGIFLVSMMDKED
ncbi:MFS transporter [Ancylomarina sp. 16SWW S1-10-2]|uniref:MFS transporter n=1 Tax=Ancylomarina sp. 16SWW S1-10-2 TaxID=2499681 RepID=UPI0012AE1B98|nr:MFS transporter [Ancylomarina sp. 16SWW S1-10-2]MRT93957.1 MFS transporter [Ancylomarina sp. 16SWW S1-10-2]